MNLSVVRFCLGFILVFATSCFAELRAVEIRVAVASNFKSAMTEIVNAYQEQSTDRVILSFGSTGKQYAQIKNGAPFDLFFAADSQRPRLLEEQGVAKPDSRFTYAQGKLALWSSKTDRLDLQSSVLMNEEYRYLAMANPKLSPYGLAAKQVIANLEILSSAEEKIVQGENIAQTFQFVSSGNADLGLVAYSQLIAQKKPLKGSYWLVPQKFYDPIQQQAVMLNQSQAIESFFKFTQAEIAQDIIRDFGYDIP